MLTAAATLATLLAGASALPAATQFGHHSARSLFASADNHLYFYARECTGTVDLQCTRCGEVDAAPYMPAALFEPRNALALAAYVEVTIRLYVNPRARATPLKLGRCASIGFTVQDGDVDGVSWWGARTAGGPQASQLMAETCGTKCKCNFRGSLSNNRLPACKDQADDPAAGTWCSLCGPSTACPGCDSGYKVTVQTYRKPSSPTRRPTAAPPTRPPKTDNHLWFRLVRSKDPFGLGTLRCGEVDAAPRMPSSLFESSNRAALARYKKVTLEGTTFVGLELGRCADVGYNVPSGAATTSWTSGIDMRGICSAQCNCRFEDPFGNNCRDRTPDNPSKGLFCSLCQEARAGSNNFNDAARIQFYEKSSAQNIVAIAVATPDLSTLVAAVKAAGLVDTLSGAGPFTVFAPTNAAFAAIQSVVDQLLLPEYKPQLIKLLTYHVLASKVVASAITNGESVATVEGQQVCFEVNHRTGAVGVFPCGSTDRASRVTTADVLASNGVVHIIDQVLVPPGFLPLPPAGQQTYVCRDDQCVISSSGVSKDDCSKICGGSSH